MLQPEHAAPVILSSHALIAALAPTPTAFRRMQLASCQLRVTSQQQFTVRCRLRKLCRQGTRAYVAYNWTLPSGRYDGACISVKVSNGMIVARKYYADGKRYGAHLRWWVSGRPGELTSYVEDKPHGAYKEWYDSGQLMAYAMYAHGKLHGVTEHWYESGQLWVRGIFVNGVIQGEYDVFSPDGQLLEHHIYDMGVRVPELDAPELDAPDESSSKTI